MIVGDVKTGDECSFWPGSVIRGDEDEVRIGSRSNLQDGAIIHVDIGFPVRIGNDVTIGHGAVLHGCTIEDNCIIGIRSVILNGSKVGRGSIIAAGAVITPGTEIPPHSLVIGMPGKVRRTDPQIEAQALENSRIYVEIAKEYMKGGFRELGR
jgi:carbonic anhydrase/acetyltransferase-like protein (isoleucine patch superfamily)